MGSHTSSGSFKPFDNLKDLLKSARKDGVQPGLRAYAEEGKNRSEPAKNPTPVEHLQAVSDEAIFKYAMADVKPLFRENLAEPSGVSGTGAFRAPEDTDLEAVLQLERLVNSGEGFKVSHTSEYMEGIACGVHPEIAERLHRGDYAVQAHIDLHGCTADNAKDRFDAFFHESVAIGRRVILIVHGRGLSSRTEPVLKTKVYEWVTCGRWRKWVLAFTSARLVDGGAGATYVLLRKRPLRKSYLR